MNNSETLAIIAIVVSAIVSIVSTVIAYLHNKANIQAKRSEIAFAKQIEAFREISEKMGRIRQIMGEKMPKVSNKAAINAFFDEMEKVFKEYYLVQQEQRVFFPPELNAASEEYGRQMSDFVHNHLFDQR